jgi:hypothetical protein
MDRDDKKALKWFRLAMWIYMGGAIGFSGAMLANFDPDKTRNLKLKMTLYRNFLRSNYKL